MYTRSINFTILKENLYSKQDLENGESLGGEQVPSNSLCPGGAFPPVGTPHLPSALSRPRRAGNTKENAKVHRQGNQSTEGLSIG